jgi:hypothetical protein
LRGVGAIGGVLVGAFGWVLAAQLTTTLLAFAVLLHMDPDARFTAKGYGVRYFFYYLAF